MFLSILTSSLIAAGAMMAGVYGLRILHGRVRQHSVLLISFAAGLLISNAFLHLLPEAVELSSYWPYWALAAILLFYLVEQLVVVHSCAEEDCEVHHIGTMGIIGMGFHSLVDGLAIGASFEASYALGLITSLAIIFHKLAEGGCTYALLVHGNFSTGRSLCYSWLVALCTPAGAILAFLFLRESGAAVLGGLLAAAAGIFIYFAASDLLPMTHHKNKIGNLVWFLAGVAAVFVLTVFV